MTHEISRNELFYLLENIEDETYLLQRARQLTDQLFGRRIYVRGLIEFTNYCNKTCLYCGIRGANKQVERYRLSLEAILAVCQRSYAMGFRTFVLQGGEDAYYDNQKMVSIVKTLRENFKDCAITLSIGEKNQEAYQDLFNAGANRFLLRHETIHQTNYESLHPNMSYHNRINCLKTLKSIGYQTGTGFLIGLPNQVITDYVDDLLFMKQLNPEMVGIGPFIPHKDTPLGKEKKGSIRTTQIMLALIRLLLPNVLLPSTTAFNTLSEDGFISGFNAGANVFMLNITPDDVREKYTLYEGKSHIDIASETSQQILSKQLMSHHYQLDMSRGDYMI
jgi:biotin synthase